MAKIVVDAGHGGSDPGAVFEGRQEKDDNLRLALAVGEILQNNGEDVVFTRTEDIYQTPFQKATIANEEKADYFISLHRNSSPMPNQYHGVETLVYRDSGIPSEIGENINSGLEELGFRNLGVKERPGLVVLRRTKMPAVLVEAGFINSDTDNRLFDENFDAMAQNIANGLLQAIHESSTVQEAGNSREVLKEDTWRETERAPEKTRIYRVQVGAFSQPQNAEALLFQLQQQGFPAYTVWEDGFYKVLAGDFEKLDNAVRLEQVLRRYGYNTFITG
ncbi:MAG: N-acetylmuramoyl-L-alanine amidase [Blautia sp.]|nr:N-acetylmuramoyl-L-alanine amidase [Blautia sp.]MDY4515608.1 N-acetylmuramoyl-L-alanine amidase [Lachnospiraceae bacterium]